MKLLSVSKKKVPPVYTRGSVWISNFFPLFLAIFFRFSLCQFWLRLASYSCENRCPKMEPYNRLWLDYYATWLSILKNRVRKNGAIQQGVARWRCNMVVESQNKAHYSTQDCASRSFGVVVSFWCVFVVVFCAVSAVVLWCIWGGVLVVVFWWCFCDGVWWWCFCWGFCFFGFWCGGVFWCVFVVVFCAVSAVVLWCVWGGVFVVVFWWCFCDGVWWWCFCWGFWFFGFWCGGAFWVCFCGGVLCCFCGGFGGGVVAVFFGVFLWWCFMFFLWWFWWWWCCEGAAPPPSAFAAGKLRLHADLKEERCVRMSGR